MPAMSVADLVDRLGPTVLRVVHAPAGLGHAAGEPELLDLADPNTTGSGALLLGVGLRPDDSRIADAVEAAARNEAAALVIKCRGAKTDSLRALADRVGVTILDAEQELSWRRLEALCGTVLVGDTGADWDAGRPVHGGDLFALANAVAALVGGAVAIMDTNEVVVAYSSVDGQPTDETRRRSILSRRVPEEALPSFLSPAVWRSRSVVRVKRAGDLDRLAVVVRAGSEALGSLWVAVADDADTTEREKALLEAAKLAALEMLRLRRHTGAEQQRRNRALRALLDGESEAGVTFPGCLLTLTAPRPGDDVRGQTMGLQLQDLVTVAAAAFNVPVATALIGDHVHVLVTVPANGRRQATIFAEHVLARACGALRGDFLVVASDEIADPNDLRERCVDNDAAVEYLVRTGVTSGVLDVGVVRADLVLDRISGLVGARADLRSGLAERISAHDAAKGTEFVASLLAYLRAFGDIAAASAALHIHQNTLRHRLRRAETLFSIELERPERLLLLWIELVARTR